uniref:G-protein coupled receptors family 1 profile domain-containing protein n=1 Tax=Pelodiscus sinensis TaxID=13735 RepID=K7FDT7_PELSI
MEQKNQSFVTEFVFIGLSSEPTVQTSLFVVFLVFYLLTIVGNIIIITVIRADPQLHTPMYFFLSNLSFLDICYISTNVPQLLVNLSTRHHYSFDFYIMLCYIMFYGMLVKKKCFDLTETKYTKAECRNLHKDSGMSRGLCLRLVISSYVAGTVNAVIHTTATFRLDFCGPNTVNHFFCDVPPLLALSSSDTRLNEILLFTFAGFVEMSSLAIILVSYAFILSAILRIRSTEGRHKAFSTCSSHFTGVTLFYGTIIFMYLRPMSVYALDQDKWASVFYTVVIPMLNPLIYSLRNKDAKTSLRKLISRELS